MEWIPIEKPTTNPVSCLTRPIEESTNELQILDDDAIPQGSASRLTFYRKSFSHEYRKILRWAAQEFGQQDQLTKLLETDCPWIDQIVKMRNVVEHPDNNPDAPLTVHNFRILNAAPPWEVAEPVWFNKGRPPAPIAGDMDTSADNLLTLYEDLLIDCLLRRQGDGPFCIVEIPEVDRNQICPYRLTVGMKPEWSRGLPEA